MHLHKSKIPLKKSNANTIGLSATTAPGGLPFGTICAMNLPQDVVDKEVKKSSTGSESPMLVSSPDSRGYKSIPAIQSSNQNSK